MRISLGSLRVTIKYTYPRGKTTIYQRPVPTPLRDRYPGKTIKHDLKTADPVRVARLVNEYNRKYEAEFEGLTASPEASPESLKAHSAALLHDWGLTPGAPEENELGVLLLQDHLDAKRERHANGDEDVHSDGSASEYLSPVEIEAWRQLHGKQPGDTITEALEVHLSTNRKRDDAKFTTYARRAFASLVAVTGDKAVKDFTRDDARRFIAKGLEDSLKTATVRRRINSFRAVWSTYRRERNPQLANPFEALAIAAEGDDAVKRIPFTHDELMRLSAACRAKDDDVRWILAMLADTGARLAEVVGAAMEDIVLDADVPHLVIKPHPWRSLKNAASARAAPLVGVSLWAAQRVKATAAEGQRFAFPRYTNETVCKATHASNTLNGWIKRLPMNHKPHELRHTMADRLRAIQCPKDIRYAIDGHAAQDVGETYGTGYGLKVKAEWLSKVALPR